MPKEKKYRLKGEVKDLFAESLSKFVISLNGWWDIHSIRPELLEEVKEIEAKITNGHVAERFGTKITHLNSWDAQDQKGKFHFTLDVLNIGCGDFKGIEVEKLMTELQTAANKFFED